MEKPVESLTRSLPSWGATLAFGESITVDGTEVVPAAVVVFGFGGGGGSGTWSPRASAAGSDATGENGAGEGEGSGGGGGGYVLPIGAYVKDGNSVTFQPNPVAILIVTVPLVTAVGWALARIVGAARGFR